MGPAVTPESQVSTPPATSSPGAVRAVATLRQQLATASPVGIRWDGEVDMSLQGTVVDRRPAMALAGPAGWEVCPEGDTSFMEATCPVSAVTAVANAQRNQLAFVVSDQAPKRLGCTRTQRPEVAPGEHLVSLRPRGAGCALDFAVNVVLEPNGRVRLVDLALDGP